MNYLTAPDGNIYTGFNYTPTLQNEFTIEKCAPDYNYYIGKKVYVYY